MQAVKDELDHMQRLGVIEPVETPTEWCAGLVVVPKPNGRVRICVDLTKLNEDVYCERHPLPAVDQRRMSTLLRDFEGVICLTDNILIYGNTRGAR